MKKTIFLVLILFLCNKTEALVLYNGTYVIPYDYGPSCLGQSYVEVGFFTLLETNNDNFSIDRSTDSGFSWWISSTPQFPGEFSGCGTCSGRQYTVLDYGPFLPNQTWYYRVTATSNAGIKTHHSLGSFINNAPTTVNWTNQVTHNVTTGSSPSTEVSYVWGQQSLESQGVSISLMTTEVSKIYLEQGNNKINFTVVAQTPIISLDVNVDNSGYSNIYNGSSITNYIWSNSSSDIYSVGGHDLKVRFTGVSGTQYYRQYDVFVVPKSDALYMDNYCNSMRVWKGNNVTDPEPLILSEGFDAYNTKSEQYYRYAGKDLINCLLTKGFDVYVVNYNLNAQSIKNNAAIFQSAIRYVSSINGGRKVVASGMSMGGVINRYACAKAEGDGNPLPISKFVTLDAPHQGAVIAENFQNWRKNLLDQGAQAGSPDPYSEFAANNDAAKELLNKNSYDPTSGIHTSFYNDLNSLNGDGYPHLVEKIGVSFSTTAPNPNTGEWIFVQLTGAPNSGGANNYHGYLSADELVAGSFLPSINVDGFAATTPKYLSGLALSLLRPITNPWVTITEYKDPTFIPHNSSLDIINGVSKFDKTIVPSVSGFHDVVPGELIEQIVNAIIEKNVYIQNKIYTNQIRTVIAREGIFAGNNVTNTISQGDVIIDQSSVVTFKAGKEIQLQNGFFVNNGADFTAKIEQVKCDGEDEFQSQRVLLSHNSNYDNSYNRFKLMEASNTENAFFNEESQRFFSNSKSETPKSSNEESLPNYATIQESNIIISPSPAHDYISIKSSGGFNNRILKLIIIDMVGEKLEIPIQSKIDISFLKTGIYSLKIEYEDGISITKKIVKI